jgi:hypothetical protein
MKKPDYFLALQQCEAQLEQAADLLDGIVGELRKLDIMHIDLLVAALDLLRFDKHEIVGFQHELTDIDKASLKLRRLQTGLMFTTAHERKRPGRSRPNLPYVTATLDLVELWQKLTGTKVVSPRGSSKTEAIQPSTEFIRLALKMIDPKVTVSNAITSIKNALKISREQTKIDLDFAATQPSPRRFQRALRLLARKTEDI